MNPRINKLLDFAERVGWTAVYLLAAQFITWTSSGDPWDWKVFGIAVGLAAAKVVVAQNMGKSSDGALPSPIKPPPEA
jgi:hypothetical protein